MGARLVQKGLPAQGSAFGSSFMAAWLGRRVRGTGTAPGAIGPAAHCHPSFSAEVQPLCLPKVQGSRMGRGWAPDERCPQSWSTVTAPESRDTAGKRRALKRSGVGGRG